MAQIDQKLIAKHLELLDSEATAWNSYVELLQKNGTGKPVCGFAVIGLYGMIFLVFSNACTTVQAKDQPPITHIRRLCIHLCE